jgi:cell division septal protein FtsQ
MAIYNRDLWEREEQGHYRLRKADKWLLICYFAFWPVLGFVLWLV